MRFRKQSDVRLISHHDLLRAFERWFRRARVPLRRSEGFHPKAKLSFPSALALGIASIDEVVEFELTEPWDLDVLRQQLDAHAPAGLEVAELRLLGSERKAQIRRATYEMPIPQSRLAPLGEKLAHVGRQTSYLIPREGAEQPLDVKAGLDLLELCGGNLRFRLWADRPGSARPREVLAALDVADLEHEGYYLTRTSVELAP